MRPIGIKIDQTSQNTEVDIEPLAGEDSLEELKEDYENQIFDQSFEKIKVKEHEKKLTKIDTKSFSISTIVCLLPFGDYQLITLVIQVITLSYRNDEKMSAATSYMKSFYNICLLCLNSGILNALGSYGAQMCGIDNFKRFNCFLR